MSEDGAGIEGGSSETRNMESDNYESSISTRSLRDANVTGAVKNSEAPRHRRGRVT